MAQKERAPNVGNAKLEALGELCIALSCVVRETTLDYGDEGVQGLIHAIAKTSDDLDHNG